MTADPHADGGPADVSVSHRSDVVGREHSPLSCALVASEHPSLVYRLHIQDQIALLERNFICLCCRVAVHGLVALLCEWRRTKLIDNNFHNQVTVLVFYLKTKMPLNVKDFMVFFRVCDGGLDIFGFWTVDQTKPDIKLGCRNL